MKTRWYIILLLLYPCMCFAYSDPSLCKFWCPTSLSGAIKLGGQYRNEKGTINQIYDYRKSPWLESGFLLNSSSYFYHPNFLILDITAEYNPQKHIDNYLVVPDQSEIRTIKRLNINTTIFKNKNIVFGTFANFDENYINRENLSTTKVNSKNVGGSMNYSNKFLPVNINYQNGTIHEEEKQTSRMFHSRQSNFNVRSYKSFSKNDNNELNYSHNTYARRDYNLSEISNTSNIITFSNSMYLDAKKNYNFNANISGTDQKGNDTYSSLQAFANYSMKLSKKIIVGTNYNYLNIDRTLQRISQNNLNLFLRHQLFESLFTDFSYDFGRIKQTMYQESSNKATLQLRYEKDLSFGHLSAAYSYSRLNQSRKSSSVQLQILNEAHRIKDGEIVLLDYPYIVTGSVIVHDATGTIFYQQLLDYTLIERNNYLEIQRIPGGQIPNNSTVYVDYAANLPGSYSYNSDFQQLNLSLQFFNRLVEVYYRWSKQDYFNLETADFQTLNFFSQNVFGSRIEYKFLSAGVEYDVYESNIVPYNLLRFYLNLQSDIKNRLLFSINGNYRNYQMIGDQVDQQYSDLSGNIAYMFTPQTKLSVELGYRKQVGVGIDLDLLSLRTEFTANYRQLDFKAGIELYRRDYLNEKVDFFGAHITVIRRFDWNKK